MTKTKRLGWALIVAGSVFAFALTGTAKAGAVLWYNGDFDNRTGLTNEINTSVTDSRVFDDFVVTDANGWTIDTIWSNNLMKFTGVATANWTIRSGVSVGNGGTIVAGGTNAATQTFKSAGQLALIEYTIAVTGLNVNLAPGTYWLQVTPVGFGPEASDRSHNSTTSGQNAVGTPPGNNVNSFWDSLSLDFRKNFAASLEGVGIFTDFSMGVAGSVNGGGAGVVAPEPSTFALSAIAALSLLCRWRRPTASP